MRNPYLYLALDASPATVKKLVEAVPTSRYDERRDPERFSFRESVSHLADHEAVALERIKVAVDTNGGPVEGYEPTQRALDQRYAELDPSAEALTYERRRAETVKYLRSLQPADWDKIHMHSERGATTVYDQLALLGSHDMFHIEHLARFLREV